MLLSSRLHANEGNIRLGVIFDGINCLFAETSVIVRGRPKWTWGPFTPEKARISYFLQP